MSGRIATGWKGAGGEPPGPCPESGGCSALCLRPAVCACFLQTCQTVQREEREGRIQRLLVVSGYFGAPIHPGRGQKVKNFNKRQLNKLFRILISKLHSIFVLLITAMDTSTSFNLDESLPAAATISFSFSPPAPATSPSFNLLPARRPAPASGFGFGGFGIGRSSGIYVHT